MIHKARHQAIKVAWDAYVEASMDPANTNLEAMSAAIDAYDALSVEIREPAKVKPLSWTQDAYPESLSIFGRYKVKHDGDEPDEWSVELDGRLLSFHPTDLAAMKAGQAHHDSRIRSALITETDNG